MRKSSLLLMLAVGTALIFASCTKEPSDATVKANAGKSGVKATNGGVIDFIKKQKLVNFRWSTIGDAFDSYSYLTKKEWKEAALKSGQLTVDFIGWFGPDALNDKDLKAGVTGKGLDVMFVIEPNGSFYAFMVTMLESRNDGKIYRNQLTDTAGVLAKIYGNQKI